MENQDPKRIISPDTRRSERVPPGQFVTEDWPILHYDGVPKIDIAKWELRAFGLLESERKWSWKEFRCLPATEVHSDWHCVTTWSKLDMYWIGVTARDVVAHLKIKLDAKAVMIHCYDKYSTNLLLEDFLEEDVIFAWGEKDIDLSPEKGGPLRLVVPKLYAWKSAKWVTGIEFIDKDVPGYWEQRGYHMHGDPWTEERYG